MKKALFRGKRLNDGTWITGYLVESTRSYYHVHGLHPHKMWIVTNALSNGGWFSVVGRFAVADDSVGQFIGLQDARGVDIFEGDIIEWGGKRYEVRYLEKYARFAAVRPGTVFAVFDLSGGRIVGNIYDNHDLIEENDDEQSENGF